MRRDRLASSPASLTLAGHSEAPESGRTRAPLPPKGNEMSPRSASGNGASVRASTVPIKPSSHHLLGRQKNDSGELTPFARAFRAARVAAGVPQVDVARHLRVGPSAIGNVETAKGSGTASVLTEEHVRTAAALFRCDPAPLLAARERSLMSFRLSNLSEEHAETAIALRDAWETATPEMLRRVRTALVRNGDVL